MNPSNQTNSTPSSENKPKAQTPMATPQPSQGQPHSSTSSPQSKQRERSLLPELTKFVVPHGDGWNARQYDQLHNNVAIHDLLAAVAELQHVNQMLIKRINGCKDC